MTSMPRRSIASLKSRYTPRPPGPTPRPSSHTCLALRDATSRGTRFPKLGYWRSLVTGLLWNPDAAVVAQRLAHERELRLVVARHRNARGVDLRVAGVGKQ